MNVEKQKELRISEHRKQTKKHKKNRQKKLEEGSAGLLRDRKKGSQALRNQRKNSKRGSDRVGNSAQCLSKPMKHPNGGSAIINTGSLKGVGGLLENRPLRCTVGDGVRLKNSQRGQA